MTVLVPNFGSSESSLLVVTQQHNLVKSGSVVNIVIDDEVVGVVPAMLLRDAVVVPW